MSEHQFIHFLAVQRALDENDVAYVRRQAGRVEVEPWDFICEGPRGDFHGNPKTMLRRCFDLFLHYDTAGVRRLMLHLPDGIDCEQEKIDAFLDIKGIKWHADRPRGETSQREGRRADGGGQGSQGRGRRSEGEGKSRSHPDPGGPLPDGVGKRPPQPGGILEISPPAGIRAYRKEIGNPQLVLRKIIPLRGMLGIGDLRPLYLAWLACTDDEDAMEPPIPAELRRMTPALKALAGLYEIPLRLIAAAAERSPALPESKDEAATRQALARWTPAEARRIERRLRCPVVTAIPLRSKALICEELECLLTGNGPAARMAAGIPSHVPPNWPVGEPTRILGQLRALAKAVGRSRRE